MNEPKKPENESIMWNMNSDFGKYSLWNDLVSANESKRKDRKVLEAQPDITMQAINPPSVDSPAKHLNFESDISEAEDMYKTPVKNKQQEEDKWGYGENGTPGFYKFSKQALGIESSSKKSIQEVLKSNFKNSCSTVSKKNLKYMDKGDEESVSAWKSILKKSKLELIGVLISGMIFWNLYNNSLLTTLLNLF